MSNTNADHNTSVAPSTPVSQPSPAASTRSSLKRPSENPPSNPEESGSRRKASKVSRACDYCKLKKLKCSGTKPCTICSKKSLVCHYNAQYRRGRPPTPPSVGLQKDREGSTTPTPRPGTCPQPALTQSLGAESDPRSLSAASHSSPGLETAEIEGQIVDSTSNLSFIHRAWRRLALQKQDTVATVVTGSEHFQPLMSAGDKPFTSGDGHAFLFLEPVEATQLFNFYFDNCIMTYRLLNQRMCLEWLQTAIYNSQNNLPIHNSIEHARAAITVNILAIASLRKHRLLAVSDTQGDESYILQQSELYFNASLQLTATETGLPRLESAQARLLQVLYLLQTSRMNQAWHVFGCTVPIVLAIGLHRKLQRTLPSGTRTSTTDYITTEFRKRTFWVVYTIDKYLAVVFGRPRFYHKDDVDQDFPDRVNDEDMTPEGPSKMEPSMDCHVDSLIFHAKIAKIIDDISREIYSAKSLSNAERLIAVQSFNRQLRNWREQLPPFLGAVRPSSLIASFSRQATTMKLAYCHAIMHANRPFLLHRPTNSDPAVLKECVLECINAAKLTLETIDGMFDNPQAPFCALWWTPYVTFCALAVVYVWEIQQKAADNVLGRDQLLFPLAEKCQEQLTRAISSESGSRRYTIIIEELRLEALHNGSQSCSLGMDNLTANTHALSAMDTMVEGFDSVFDAPTHGQNDYSNLPNGQGEWQASDWLDLDFSAFGLSPNIQDFI